MAFIGKALHLSVDLVLLSATLAGLKRSTGWTIKTESAKDTAYGLYLKRYLDVGEWTLDLLATQMAMHPEWFEKRQ